MPLQISSLAADIQATEHPQCNILKSRQQYISCHLLVPDEEKPVAGIVFNNQYYSFLKSFQDRQKSRKVASRLLEKGKQIVITPTAKGEAIWTLELEASPISRLTKPTVVPPLRPRSVVY